jgi:putative resolvase
VPTLSYTLCEQFAAEGFIINASGEANLEEDLAQEVIEIVTVPSARL